MTNKRPLKSYIRYDGSGRAVSSSLIWRKNKPKVGNWKEVQGYECCNPVEVGLYTVILIDFCGLGFYNVYYSDRDLSNTPGQCLNGALAVGAKLYKDSQGTIPVDDCLYITDPSNPILLGINYNTIGGVIVTAPCP